MRLYLLTRNIGDRVDVAEAMVVAAHSELEARNLAAENRGDEPHHAWWEEATCVVLTPGRKARLVLRSFIAG